MTNEGPAPDERGASGGRPAVTCPRCDYDLAGMVASWTDACPMRATCSECGLEFETTNVLSPRVLGPRWSFEHGPRFSVRRWLRTSCVALRARRLCTELRIDHVVRGCRLLLFMFLWLVLTHVGAATGAAMLTGIAPRFRGWAPGFILDREVLRAFLMPYTGTLSIPVGPSRWTEVPAAPFFLITFAPTALMPCWMIILGETFRRARVRRVHLLRGLAYTLPLAAVAAASLIALFIGEVLADNRGWLPTLPRSVAMAINFAELLAFPAYHTWWWSMFVRDYLRLRHALVTVVLMQIMSLMVVAIVIAILSAHGARY